MDISQFGATIKAKYPQYKDLSDQELGTKMLAKYPQYKDMVDLPQQVKIPQITKQNQDFNILDLVLGKVKNYGQDVGAAIGQRLEPGAYKSQQAATEMAQKAADKAGQIQATNPEAAARLRKVAGEGFATVGGTAREMASRYSPDIKKPYLQRGFETGAEIATTADLLSGLLGSPAIGAFKEPSKGFVKGTLGLNKPASLAPKDLIESVFKPTGQQSVVKTTFNALKTLTSPLKTTGKALENARKEVPVDINDFRSDWKNKLKDTRAYKTASAPSKGGKKIQGAFQKEVQEVVRRATDPLKNQKITSLDDIYQNLIQMKDVNDDALRLVKESFREAEKEWGNKTIEKLAGKYSTLLNLETNYGRTARRAAVGTGVSIATGALLYNPIKKLLGFK